MFKIRAFAVILLALPLLILFASCSDETPTEPQPGGDGIQWAPDGVLLEGDPNSLAMNALIDLAPSPADPEAVTSDDLVTTRLVAFIDQEATVGQVNGSLNGIGARIVGMAKGTSLFSLMIEPVANETEAAGLCTTLTESAAFLLAFPSYAATVDVPGNLSPEAEPNKADVPGGGDPRFSMDHFEDSRIPATWNVRNLVRGFNFPVIVPDKYVTTTPHGDLSNQVFPVSPVDLTSTTLRDGVYPGNHGFHVTGIIGADWDDDDVYVGVHPDPSSLSLRSVPIGRLDWGGILLEIWLNLPHGGKFVLNTSIGFRDENFAQYSKAQRISYGMAWRRFAHAFRNRSIHATASGNTGRAHSSYWTSPFTVSASQDDLLALLGSDAESNRLRPQLTILWNQMKASMPGADLKPSNVFVVGSSHAETGAAADSSANPADVRMVGVEVSSLCSRPDQECSPPGQFMSGTSMATPQVAGLAAYMWTLDLNQSPGTIHSAIKHAYNNAWVKGVVDGYVLILGMDKSTSESPIRDELLDVANSQGAEGNNAAFDDHDLALYLAKFQHYENERAGPSGVNLDHSRFDLNGDGYTGGDSTATFDLDINQPPAFGTVPQDIRGIERSLDEKELTDFDILCYYAYSDLFTGDQGRRDALLQDCVPFVKLFTEFPDVVFPNQPATLKVKAGTVASKVALAPGTPLGYTTKADTTWIEGLDIQLNPTGGQVASPSGRTDVGGSFTTTATIDEVADLIEIDIIASQNGNQVATAKETGMNGPRAVLETTHSHGGHVSATAVNLPVDCVMYDEFSEIGTTANYTINPSKSVTCLDASASAEGSMSATANVGDANAIQSLAMVSTVSASRIASGNDARASARANLGAGWYFNVVGAGTVKFRLTGSLTSADNSSGGIAIRKVGPAPQNMPGDYIFETVVDGPVNVADFLSPGRYSLSAGVSAQADEDNPNSNNLQVNVNFEILENP
jgi:hypothetical protein